jgi:hypothetical protein
MLMEYLEGRLGTLDLWPSYILQHIFHDRPSPVASHKLKKVVAFFYGNGVPCFIASRFYCVSNETVSRSAVVSRFVDETFHEWYYVWMRAMKRIHMAVYYDMRTRQHCFINGSMHCRYEPVTPDLPVFNFGVDNTMCRRIIMSRMEEIKAVSVFE